MASKKLPKVVFSGDQYPAEKIPQKQTKLEPKQENYH